LAAICAKASGLIARQKWGAPVYRARTPPIPIARPWFDEREALAVKRVLASGWVMQGPEVEAFEREFAAYVGSKSAAACSSGTAALHLALLALGVHAGDEVICPAFTFVATANAVRLVGAEPVFADIDPATYNVTAATIAPLITRRTVAIVVVHEFGLAADMSAIGALARKHDLRVIEDAACAVGASWRGRYVGTFGDFGTFSFHPRKILTTGEGGMVVARSPAMIERVRELRNHGAAARGDGDFTRVGLNYRLTDLQAAVGRVQLAKLPAMIAERRLVAAAYSGGLRGTVARVPVVPRGATHTFQSYVVGVKDRAAVMAALAKQGISTRPGAHAVPLLAAYRRYKAASKVKAAVRAHEQALALPVFPGITEAERVRVIDAIRDVIVSRSRAVRARFPPSAAERDRSIPRRTARL
jgi:perosamine synthetase